MNLEKDPATLHVPVMLDRTIELLAPALEREGAVVIDCTLGMGGHSEALLTRFKNLTLIGIDRDPQAIEIAAKRLSVFGDRVILRHAVYDQVAEILADLEIKKIDGALLDLGVSSLQLDEASRGFAYAQDAPLDMRMNTAEGQTAAELVNEWSEAELRNIFNKYGEEPLAARYARAIVTERQTNPIVSTGQLVDLLQEATPYAKKNLRHPAKRVFQALRVAVNDELSALEAALPQVLEALDHGGRVVVLAYQSLEDRIVKKLFKDVTTSKTPIGVPVELPEFEAKFKLLVRGSELADSEEQEVNSRSKPVRLRAVERKEVQA